MLKVMCSRDKIEVWFYHKFIGIPELSDFVGISFDGNRRCSWAIVKVNGNDVYQGIAICHPNDNFSRAIGRKRALTDALRLLSKDIRTAVWKEYRVQCSF